MERRSHHLLHPMRLLGPLAGVALAVGCAPAPAPPPGPVAPAPAAPAAPAVPAAPVPAAPVQQAERGGTFQLAARQQVPHLNYWKDSGVAVNVGLNPIYERLVSFDYKPPEDWRADYRVVPWLAERWEQPDPRTYIFHIRKGVKWHDGTDFTAADVAWAYEYLRDPKNGFRGGANVREADTITAEGTTVRITTKLTSATFLSELADTNAPLQPRHIIEQGQKHEDVAIGTGPYKVASYDRQKGLELVRNDLYWQGGGKPYLDKVKIIWGVDASAMLAAFQTKQNDVLKVTDKVQFDTVKRLSPNMGSEVFQRDIVNGLWMHVDRPPYNDVRVRRALHLGIDRQRMVDALTFGLGMASPPAMHGGRTGWVIAQEELKTLPGWRQPKDQDIAEARRLLKEAGAEGLKMVNRYTATHTTTPLESEVMAQQLKQIGVEMQLDPIELGAFLKAFQAGDFDVATDAFVRFAPERDWNNFAYSKGSGNSFGINDPELDRLIEAQAAELDVKKRQQLFVSIQRLMLDKMYVIPTLSHVGFTLWQPYVHGWVDNYAGQAANQEWSRLWVDVKDVPKDR